MAKATLFVERHTNIGDHVFKVKQYEVYRIFGNYMSAPISYTP